MFYNKTIKERDSGGRGRRTHLVAIHFILKKVVHRAKILERFKSRIDYYIFTLYIIGLHCTVNNFTTSKKTESTLKL